MIIVTVLDIFNVMYIRIDIFKTLAEIRTSATVTLVCTALRFRLCYSSFLYSWVTGRIQCFVRCGRTAWPRLHDHWRTFTGSLVSYAWALYHIRPPRPTICCCPDASNHSTFFVNERERRLHVELGAAMVSGWRKCWVIPYGSVFKSRSSAHWSMKYRPYCEGRVVR